MTNLLNQVLGLISGAGQGLEAEHKGDEDRRLKAQQISAMYGTRGMHIEKGADGQYYQVDAITGTYKPLRPEDVGFGQGAQPPAPVDAGQAVSGVTPPVSAPPPVGEQPVPPVQQPSVPPPVSPAIPGIPPRMAAAIGGMKPSPAPVVSAPMAAAVGGLRVPQKPAPLTLGQPNFNDAKVAEQHALALDKFKTDSANTVNLAPIKATADSLTEAKKLQAQQAAGPVMPFGDTPAGIKAAADKVAAETTAKAAAELAAGKKGTSALMLQAMNRLGLSQSDIASAITQMDKFESDPKNRAQLNIANQTLGATAMTSADAHASGIMGALNSAGGTAMSAAARAKLNKEFPGYLTYLRNKQIVGLAATEILPRPNAQLLGIESGIAGIANDTPDEVVRDVQDRRHRMRDMLAQSLATTPLGAPKTGAPTHTTAAQSLWDQAVAKHGEAKVLKEYGPRPHDDE